MDFKEILKTVVDWLFSTGGIAVVLGGVFWILHKYTGFDAWKKRHGSLVSKVFIAVEKFSTTGSKTEKFMNALSELWKKEYGTDLKKGDMKNALKHTEMLNFEWEKNK